MSESNPNISVIIPVYNVERYLSRCLDSIFNQQFSGTYEVIVVEDASTDNSLQLLKLYQDKQPRLKIIEHGVNKKLSVARATGMKAATGDYIMHVDSDDWLLPDAFENLFRCCIETNADVVVFNHVRENSEGVRTSVRSIQEKLVTADKLSGQHHFLGAPWNKIVKRVLTDNLISGEVGVNNTEDLLYASEIFLRSQRICLVPMECYAYFVNTQSLTWQIRPEDYLRNQITILSQLQRIIDRYDADVQCVDIILNYFEKFIYLEFAKIKLLHLGSAKDYISFLRELACFPVITEPRIFLMEQSLNSTAVCLAEVAKRFGGISAIRLVLSCLKKRIFSRVSPKGTA